MQIRNALVAVLCSAILSAGLAIGLGAGGSADAASSTKTLKQIKSQLDDVNRALGHPTAYGHDISEMLQQICDETPENAC